MSAARLLPQCAQVFLERPLQTHVHGERAGEYGEREQAARTQTLEQRFHGRGSQDALTVKRVGRCGSVPVSWCTRYTRRSTRCSRRLATKLRVS